MYAGFRAEGVAHHLVNRSSADVVYLELGDRSPGDAVHYPSDDIKAAADGGRFMHKDYDAVLDEILEERVSSSRSRRNPRGAKRKMSSYALKRRTRKRPPPPIDIAAAIRIRRRKITSADVGRQKRCPS